MRSLKKQGGWVGVHPGLLSNPGTTIPIVAGIIIGYDSAAAAPSGWANFNSADGKAILGTTSDGEIGNTGGSTSITSSTSTSSGSHTGSADIGVDSYRTTSGDSTTVRGADGTSYGSHNHTITSTLTPAKNQCRLIRATADGIFIPTNGILFTVSADTPPDFTDFTTFNNNSAILGAASSVSTSSASWGHSVNTKSVSHDHDLVKSGSRVHSSIATYVNDSSMSHNHTFSPTSRNMYLNQIILKAWKASKDVRKNDGGLIALYNGTGVPDKWALCDGTGGTPNMNAYFSAFNGTPGTVTTRANTVSISGSLNSKGHNHSYGGSPSITGVNIAHNAQSYHSHTVGSTGKAYTPPYYKLKFIKFTG